MVKERREIKEIIARYIGELDKLGIEVSQVILYGSYANGKHSEYSDIDVAVISPAFTKLDIFERQEILSRAHHKFHVPLEPIGLTPKQLEEKQGFVHVIVESGITLFKQTLSRDRAPIKEVLLGQRFAAPPPGRRYTRKNEVAAKE